MEQRAFNLKIEDLANQISKKYSLDSTDKFAYRNALYKIDDEVYDNIDYNFQQFDDATFEFKEVSRFNLEITVNIIADNKVIQEIKFTL